MLCEILIGHLQLAVIAPASRVVLPRNRTRKSRTSEQFRPRSLRCVQIYHETRFSVNQSFIFRFYSDKQNNRSQWVVAGTLIFFHKHDGFMYGLIRVLSERAFFRAFPRTVSSRPRVII